jgi:hypothetical protein
MSEYPNAIDSFDAITPEQPMDDHDQVHNAVASSVVAVETALGTDVAGTYENVSTRLDANDSLVGAIRSQMADFVGSQPAGEYVFADKVTATGDAQFNNMVDKTLIISIHATDANGEKYPLDTLQAGENMQVTIGENVYDCGVNSRVALKGEPDWQGNRSTIGHILDLAVRGDDVPSKPSNGTRLELNIKGNEDLTVEDIAEITRNSVQNAEGKSDQKLWLGTAAEYANISVKDPNTLYVYTP